MKIKGTLISIGGNEDKGFDEVEGLSLDFVTDSILSTIVKESGGTDAHILVVTTASQIPVEVGENYISAFNRLGFTNLSILDIRDREKAESEEVLSKVRTAECIMFSGGDQSRIIDIIGGTEMHQIILNRLQNEPVVIAGTSAGAMAMSSEMIYGGSSTESLQKGSVKMREGLGLFPSLIIDSHFIKRGRFGRLAEAVAHFPNLVGVGLAEDTAIVIKSMESFRVIGSGMVIVFDGRTLTHNNIEILEEGTPMTMANLTVHVLANGDAYSLKDKKVKALALDASFI